MKIIQKLSNLDLHVSILVEVIMTASQDKEFHSFIIHWEG